MEKIKFENNMKIVMDGYERHLTRWTKGGYDRIYINGGSKAGDGFVDIKNGKKCLRHTATYAIHMADYILNNIEF